MPFALGYDEAHGATHSLDTVKGNAAYAEKEQFANCISCKTHQYTALVNAEGDTAYQGKFNDMIDQFDEPISCYNCHENDPTQLVVGNKFFVKGARR